MVALTLQPYQQGSEKAVQWLLSHLEADGSYGSNIQDLASYYKSPYLFYLSGRVEEAYHLLSYIQRHFMRHNGDFVTADTLKSENPALGEYWGSSVFPVVTPISWDVMYTQIGGSPRAQGEAAETGAQG